MCGRGRQPCARMVRFPARAYAAHPDQVEAAMFEWPEELEMVRGAVRDFVDTEIRPHRDELEHGDLPPYDLLRKLYAAFGIGSMARDSFERRIAQQRAAESGTAPTEDDGEVGESAEGSARPGFGAAMAMMPII